MKALLAPCVLALLPTLTLAAERADFARVKPILAKHCVACHGPDKQRADLRLDTATAIRKGGNSGPAAVPGKSADSLLIQAVTGAEDVKIMPPRGRQRLTKKEIAALRAWIDAGAPVPAGEVVGAVARSKHWSFQPIVRHPAPAVKQRAWVRTPLDAFILARLEAKGVKPSAEADRVTLLRRAHLDLTGIPPTPEQVDAFLADRRPDAYEKMVDRLLASPHYGERWGRHWLDAARYADSNGYSIDSPRSIWKYRDWVIAALNRDLPFDRFTIEQLAGDLLPGATRAQKIATGFHRNTMINEEGGIDLEQFRVEAIVDRTNTTATVFLGLTLGCAQCHDHKFDPLSQKEYYRLYAFFNNSDDPRLDLTSVQQMRSRKALQADIARLSRRLHGLERLSPAILEKWEGSLTPQARAMLPRHIQHILTIAVNGRTPRQEQLLRQAYRNIEKTRHVVAGLAGPFSLAANVHALTQRRVLEKQIAERKRALPASFTTLALNERKMARMAFVQLGGDFLRKGALVTPGVPSVLPPLRAPSSSRAKGRGVGGEGARLTRLDLARWLVSGKNPLTARVMVNRVWQHYFGSGLVETENDFGTQGTRPSHPKLLDWLADEFMVRGWSMKKLHRLIVTSSVYRQSSHARPDLRILDPRNRLLARQHRVRLEAEVVRDVALSASGLLTSTIGGPSVFPPQPLGVYSFTQVPRTWRADLGPQRYRRGLYTWFWRSAPHPGLIVFDAPDATSTCTRRNRSNTPLQALTLLNDQAFFECALALAARVLREVESGDEERLTRAFRLALARAPRERERQILTRLLRQQRLSLARSPQEARGLVRAGLPRGADVVEHAAWGMVARVLLNLDEFITRE
jgi:hypothetical protein